MKNNKKAFTLIELLAVIIILAIIALIATPIVLDVVDKSKKSAFEASAYGMLDAIRFKTMEDRINEISLIKEYTFPSNEIEVQGEQPKGGTIKVDKDGRITVAIHNEKWCATKGYNEGKITVKDYVEGECILQDETKTPDDEVVLTGSPIVDKVKPLVYDENGICKTDGTTYQYMGGCYLKAEPSTTLANHIWYNGFLWRIMGINSDGSVRMITEENVTSISYNVADNTNFANSHVDKWLNDYFYTKLSNENNLKTNVIVSGTFCQGSATSTSSSNRIDCTNGTELTRNVGLLSIDEYNLSGGSSSYLKNSQLFWTMSPYNSSDAWEVYNNGNADSSSVSYSYGLRPVINVNSNTTITSGNGTLSDYYVLGENKGDTNIPGTLTTAKIVEYVMLNDKRYRVVENGSTTKLIFDGYYQETEGTNYTMKYGSDNVFTIENRNIEDATLSGIGYKLNTDVLDWLTAGDNQEKLKSMIIPSTWYQNIFSFGNSYEISLNETNPTRSIENVQVGLIRVGEMLSGQSYSILTQNGTVVSSFGNTARYWTMTPSTSSSNAWYVYNHGAGSNNRVIDAYGVRPVINVNSNVTITTGNGTLGHEYIIEVK